MDPADFHAAFDAMATKGLWDAMARLEKSITGPAPPPLIRLDDLSREERRAYDLSLNLNRVHKARGLEHMSTPDAMAAAVAAAQAAARSSTLAAARAKPSAERVDNPAIDAAGYSGDQGGSAADKWPACVPPGGAKGLSPMDQSKGV